MINIFKAISTFKKLLYWFFLSYKFNKIYKYVISRGKQNFTNIISVKFISMQVWEGGDLAEIICRLF